MDAALARTAWHLLEAVNAVTYFAPECREAPARLGLKGFWMGYFACRAAPLGAAGPGVVEATFFNFHPDRVRRAIPDAWSIAPPEAVVAARGEAAAAALRRILGDGDAEDLAKRVRAATRAAIEAAGAPGRPLFAANRDVPEPADPVAAMWQAATTLREHRGDGHVALLAGAGLDGCEAHVLFAACEGVAPELFLQSRGWSGEDWAGATARLAGRGLVAPGGDATAAGRALREGIERRTDELAVAPYAAAGEEPMARLVADLGPAAGRIAAAGDIIFPNPMGLPRPASPQ